MIANKEFGLLHRASRSEVIDSPATILVPPDLIRSILEFPEEEFASIKESISKSLWFSIDGGRIMTEVRNPAILSGPIKGDVYFADFDDTLFRASAWHLQAYALTVNLLSSYNSEFTSSHAKELYEASKITIPHIAEHEPRYTPYMNLVLLSQYAKFAKDGASHQDAFRTALQLRNNLQSTIRLKGEDILRTQVLDMDIKSLYSKHSPEGYIYDDFVDDLVFGTEPEDLRIIATRGKIGGPLGQVHKVHASAILDRNATVVNSRRTGGFDMIYYTQDLKASLVAEHLGRHVPEIREKRIVVYDDNPEEDKNFFDKALSKPDLHIEVIQPRHPDSKRREKSPENLIPLYRVLENGEQVDIHVPIHEVATSAGTVFDHYGPGIPHEDKVVLKFPMRRNL